MAYSAELIRAKRRTESSTVTEPRDNKVDQPDYQCIAYRAQIGDVKMMRDVYGGTKTMRAGREDYLSMHPMETPKKYEDRLNEAIAYNALSKTVDGLIGMIFRRDPVLAPETPDAVVDAAADIDRRGTALPIFARRAAENALIDGHTWIHVETPQSVGSVRNRSEERALGIRPYWLNIRKEDAINWRYESRNGAMVLTLFAYREGAIVASGEFGEASVERVRVMRDDGSDVSGELWELVTEDDKQRWRKIEEYPIEVDEIPVVFLSAHRTQALGESDPPLRDLAYEQIEHYRRRSDRQRALMFSSVAVPYLFGEGVTDADGHAKVTWGPDGMMVLSDPTAKAGVIESHGYGLEATKDELADIEGRMAKLGLQMLATPNTTPQTATERMLDGAQDDAALVVFAKLIEDALNNALAHHAAYTRDEPTTLEINRDFRTQVMEPGLIKELRELVAAGRLSQETLWALLVRGEVLGEDFDPDEEQERIAEEDARFLGEA